MRHRLAAIAALALCCAPPAHAGTVYAIDFSSLAPDAGQGVSTTFQAGPFLVSVNDVTVIGPSSPDYSGAVGITIPSSGDNVTILDATGVGPGAPFAWYSLSATFATTSAGDAVYWDVLTGPRGSGTPYTLDAAAPGTLTAAPNPSPSAVPELLLLSGNQDRAQLTGLTITADLSPAAGTTPEPSGLLLAGIGLAGAVATAISRSRCRGRASR